MAGVGHLLLSKIIEEQSLHEVQNLGVKPFHFSGDNKDIYEWILDYHNKHGAVPTERALGNEYGDFALESVAEEPWSGLVEELFAAYSHGTLVTAVSDAMQELEDDDPKGALQTLSKGVQSAAVQTQKLRDFNIIEGWEERLAQYEEMRKNPNALRGIPTGFYGLDKITHGLRPQQFIVMAGEQKRGKSLFLLIMANAAHVHGKRPMFISYEMSVTEQLARYDALRAHIPYDNVLSGNLTDDEMARIRKQMLLNKDMQDFIMSEDASGSTTLGSVSSKVQEFQPDILFVDGVYLMDDENGEPKGDWKAITNITRGFKRLAQHHDIPVVVTTQALGGKLQNKTTRKLDTGAIGYSSSFGQDADLLLGVERNPDLDDQAIIRVLDGRSVPRVEVHVKWDWQTMEFEEVEIDGPIDPAFL